MLLTHMYHWNGRLLPVEQLCALAREHGIVTVVDGAQTFAQMPVSFRELGCDIFITSLHKWLGAPVGNGMLVVREGLIDDTWPLLAPFDPPPLRIDKFDHWNLGTYNSAIQAGIVPAIRLHRRIGVERIQRRLRELTRYWIERAREFRAFACIHRLMPGPLMPGPWAPWRSFPSTAWIRASSSACCVSSTGSMSNIAGSRISRGCAFPAHLHAQRRTRCVRRRAASGRQQLRSARVR